MKQFEYKSLWIGFLKSFDEINIDFVGEFNKLGKEGWELIAFSSGWAFFKREIDNSDLQKKII